MGFAHKSEVSMKRKMTFVVFIVAALFLMAGPAMAEAPIDAVKANIKKSTTAIKDSVPTISVAEFKKLIDEQKVFFEIIDVRGQDEYDAGHLADAIHTPRGKAEWMIPEKVKDPNTPIYVYCKSGTRGALVTRMLLDAGYAKVTNVAGGFMGWAKAGYPFYNLHGEVVVVKDGFGKKPE